MPSDSHPGSPIDVAPSDMPAAPTSAADVSAVVPGIGERTEAPPASTTASSADSPAPTPAPIEETALLAAAARTEAPEIAGAKASPPTGAPANAVAEPASIEPPPAKPATNADVEETSRAREAPVGAVVEAAREAAGDVTDDAKKPVADAEPKRVEESALKAKASAKAKVPAKTRSRPSQAPPDDDFEPRPPADSMDLPPMRGSDPSFEDGTTYVVTPEMARRQQILKLTVAGIVAAMAILGGVALLVNASSDHRAAAAIPPTNPAGTVAAVKPPVTPEAPVPPSPATAQQPPNPGPATPPVAEKTNARLRTPGPGSTNPRATPANSKNPNPTGI